MIIFSTKNYSYLKESLLNQLKSRNLINKKILTLGILEEKTFPDGETYHRIISDVSNKEVVLVGGTESNSSCLDLYDLACSISNLGARKLKIFIPYFGYSTMERAIKSGEVVKAKVRANLLSSIPKCPEGIEVYLFDLHSEGIPYYFEGDIKTKHLYCKDLVKKAVFEIIGNNDKKDFVLASTDAGRAKWVESLSKDFELNSAFVYKRRNSGDSTSVTGINADVKDKNVIIYDDMIRTGGSLIGAAEAYKNAGAKDIHVITTHLVIPNDSLNKLMTCGLFKKIYATDTHPRHILLDNKNILSITNLIWSELLPSYNMDVFNG